MDNPSLFHIAQSQVPEFEQIKFLSNAVVGELTDLIVEVLGCRNPEFILPYLKELRVSIFNARKFHKESYPSMKQSWQQQVRTQIQFQIQQQIGQTANTQPINLSQPRVAPTPNSSIQITGLPYPTNSPLYYIHTNAPGPPVIHKQVPVTQVGEEPKEGPGSSAFHTYASSPQ